MAVDGSPEAPIAAVRVAPAEPVAAAQAAVAEAVALPAADPAPAAAAALPAPAPEPAAKAEPKVELVAERPSLLEKATDKPKPEPVKAEAAADKPKDGDVKPADAKAEVKPEPKVEAKPEVKPGEKPAEAKPAEAAKPEPPPAIEYKYTVPDTLKMDDGLKGELGTALDAFRANPAEGAQALIDLHAKTMADYAANLQTETLRNQHRDFNATRDTWNKDWAADEQIGGSGYQTALKAIARMRDQFVSAEVPGTPKYQADLKSFEEFLRITGAGDHPAFGRFLHNVAQAFDEPPLPPANPQPPKTNGQNPGSRRARMYDHPSSSKTS